MIALQVAVTLSLLWSSLALNDTKLPKKVIANVSITPVANYTLLTILDDRYGLRNVSYFNDDGLAVIDGDVIYGPIQDLIANKFDPNDVGKRRRASSVFAGSGYTWPKANITYRYDSDATETSLSSDVNNAISRWLKEAPYLTFFKLPNIAKPENGVLMITAKACGGCRASIGYADTPRMMNLQLDCKDANKEPGPCGVGATTHEFGHVLGLYHEHQRPNRESFVHYQCQNLQPGCSTLATGQTCCDSNVPAECCQLRGNFEVHSSNSVDALGPYDTRSLMHYRRDAFATSGTETLIPVDPLIVVPTTNPTGPSKRDYGRICKLYRGVCPKAKTCAKVDCPVKCVKINQCRKPGLCDDLVERPPCCDADTVNEECEKRQQICDAQGCDILL